MAARRKKNDKVSIGLGAGLVFPLFIFILIYYAKYSELSIQEYITSLWEFRVLVQILSFCVFPNLLLFLLYIRRKMDFAARGVLMATFIYALLVLASRLF